MNYCTACPFSTDDDDAMEAHIATHRGDHEALPVRAGTITPETHTHRCPNCNAGWDCDDPSCTAPDSYECDDCFRQMLESE
jgi:hypothetical protein